MQNELTFDLSEDQVAIQDTLRRFVAREYGFEVYRDLVRHQAWSPQAWKFLAEMGLLALRLPERVGGLGGSTQDLMVVMAGLGEGMMLEPYLPTTVLGAGLLERLGMGMHDRTLEQVAAGELRLALAYLEPEGRFEPAWAATTARQEGDAWRLSGSKAMVIGGTFAERLIVTARTAGAIADQAGITAFVVDAQTDGLRRTSVPSHDGAGYCDLALDEVVVPDAARIGAVDGAFDALDQVLDLGSVALCAEAVGIMDSLLEDTIEQLKTRVQFGQPIGKFQALRHRVADMKIAVEQARCMLLHAVSMAEADDPLARSTAVSGARVVVDQAARFVGQEAVQLHGGMGLTEELRVGHAFKRLTMMAARLGDVNYHQDRLNAQLARSLAA